MTVFLLWVVYLSPSMNRGLFVLQRELYDMTEAFQSKWLDWYKPDVWVPHCTVALTSEDPESAFFRASDLVLHEFKKIGGLYTSVGLVKISFPVEELARFEFEE